MNSTLKVTLPLYGGMSLARENITYFVKGAIPNETVEARILEKKRDYTLAETISLVHPSPYRIDPPCPVFGTCGGCHYQFIDYEKQLIMKQEIICDCLKRIGKLDDIPFDEALHGDTYGYRYRAQFKVVDGLIGFYRENSHEIVTFDSCLLLTARLNDVYRRLKSINIPAYVKDITVTAGDHIIAHIGGQTNDLSFGNLLVAEGIVDGYTSDQGISGGIMHAEFSLGDLRYTLSTLGFVQSNWQMNNALSEILSKSVHSILDNETDATTTPSKHKLARLIDIYGGAGNFSLPLSTYFKEIIVVEENEHSINDGIRNAELNSISNIRFLHTSAEDLKFSGKATAVIVDPPRIGLTNRTIDKILKLQPQHLFYISCNPATFSRDASKLTEMFELHSVRFIDMFPQTYHCEIFSRFHLK